MNKIKFLTVSMMLLCAFLCQKTYCWAAPDGVVQYSDRIAGSRDSVLVAEIRARMDSIRAHRPTVALVLSGGGAKGAAHIGVIEYLESIDMPIDMVLGTSMGGLVGGIYALGYPIHELDSIVRTIDWSLALSDRVPREYISYAE